MKNPSKHIFFNGLKAKELKFDRLAGAWEAISDARLDQYRSALPAAWSNKSDAIEDILRYIAQLRENIGQALTEITRVLA
ncbi:MAG: hypothetical protein ACRD82_02740 [Blastocatellia bacterium]